MTGPPTTPEPAPAPVQVWSDSVVRTEIWVHAIFLVLAAGVIVLSFAMRSEGETAVYLPGWQLALPETCASQRWFGTPCPGCGMTRAFISLSHGQPSRAWNFNPASWVLYPFVLVQIPWHLGQIIHLWRRRRGWVVPGIYYLPVAVVGLLVVQWLIRLAAMLF